MTKYHFVSEEPEIVNTTRIIGERLRAEYTSSYKGGEFEEAELYPESATGQTDERVLTVRNCQGSIILIDRERKGFRKLHIGNLKAGTKHAEYYSSHDSGEQPRADLFRFDIRYARQRFFELLRWRESGRREELKEFYRNQSWYSVPYRLAQLNISEKGLERKIRELSSLVSSLEKLSHNTFVSDRVFNLEDMYYQLVFAMEQKTEAWRPRTETRLVREKKQKPNIIVAPSILQIAEDMRKPLGEVLDFTSENADIEQASNYWQNVEAWKDI